MDEKQRRMLCAWLRGSIELKGRRLDCGYAECPMLLPFSYFLGSCAVPLKPELRRVLKIKTERIESYVEREEIEYVASRAFDIEKCPKERKISCSLGDSRPDLVVLLARAGGKLNSSTHCPHPA
jgi:hypothetical protein